MKKRQVTLLNKRITINTQTVASDGLGGDIETDSAFCKTWAAIWPVKAKEVRDNMRDDVTVTHTVRVRCRSGILNTMTIAFGSRVFEIKGIVNPDESNRYLDLVCEEKTV